MGQEYYVIRGSQSWSKPTADGMSLDDVKKKLSSINSEPVKEAGTAYSDAADALAEMSTALRGFAQTLVKHWKGDEAKKAVAQLQQVHATSINLSNSSHTNASTYTWYGTQILDWYKQAGQDASDGLIHTSGDDKHGRELMQRFLNRTGEAFNAHPTQITQDLPQDKRGGLTDTPTYPGGPGGPGNPGAGPGGLHGGGAGGAGGGFGSDPGGLGKHGAGSSSPFAPTGDGGPHLPGGTGSGGSGGFGSDPGGLGGSHGGGGSLGGSGGLGSDLSSFPGGGAGAGGGLGGGGGGLGADPGGLGGGAGAGGGLGGFGATPGGLGAAGGGLGSAGAAGRAGAGRMGGGMPMGHGGHGNGKEEERERTTWLSEDDDVWGADDDTAPPVIG
ncbi:hypothetical protein ACQPZ8_46190 [Actinomadura nitritigenes]|uniref:hypothetical protein n=1 Tax=Actinomadura nitritigenes TaxID=134602 RepID=UPI003D932C20